MDRLERVARESAYVGEDALAYSRGTRLLTSLSTLPVLNCLVQWKRISGGRPFVIKGIQSAADARRALEIGCEGIVVTNHAGRQVDGAVGSLEVLPEIVEAVGDSEC